MDKKPYQRILGLLIAAMLLLSGCGRPANTARAVAAAQMPAMVREKSFCLPDENGEYQPAFLNGVNIGAAAYGSFPGEFAISRESYLRWFKEIRDMNVQVIRVYVNQMPEFYDALSEFNCKTDRPLYLMHGVYANEDMIAETGDAFYEDFRQSFLTDIRNAVNIVHGSAQIEKRPGNAGGSYTADISPWVIGWILGIEWEADFVNGTNAKWPDRTSFCGTYVYTENASPFEVFLAEAAETVISCDLSYGTQRPVALCNWCTTDPLHHPNEPSPEVEDSATVDAEHIRGTDAFSAGFFASYHVYPYYPEFFSYDTRYTAGEDPDPYLAYLRELTAYHSMPVLISEYGIPASRGIAHQNMVSGMSQGLADEKQQAEWLIAMNRDIREAGCAGGLIFSWQDEWFKRTWNTMDYELPDRRPYWYNAQSPEECFGLLAFEPGEKEPVATVDGDAGEWKGQEPATVNGDFAVYIRADAGYLYLLVKGENYDFQKDTVYIPISVAPGRGNTHFETLRFSEGAEYLLKLHGEEDSVLTVDAAYDAFQFTYAHFRSFYDPLPGQYEKDSGCFNPIYLALNLPMYLPETKESTEFMRVETGRLRYGRSQDNSLSDFCAGEGFAEIRLPWQLIGFMDPSSKQVMGQLFAGNTVEPESTDGIRLGVARAGDEETVPMELFSWDNWDVPVCHERLKASYGLLRDYFAAEN